MDKWQKRAEARRKQREKELRQHLMIAGGAAVALLVLIFIITRVVGGSKVEKEGAASGEAVLSTEGTVQGQEEAAAEKQRLRAELGRTGSIPTVKAPRKKRKKQ